MKKSPKSPKSPMPSTRKKQSLAFLAFLAAAVPNCQSANAATITWDGGTSGTGTLWGDASNWRPDATPGTNDTVVFASTNTSNNGSAATVLGSGTITGLSSWAGNYQIGQTVTGTNIPAGSVITAIINGSTIVISNAATGTGSTAPVIANTGGLAGSPTISLGASRTIYALNEASQSNNFTLGSADDIAAGYSLTLTNVSRTSCYGNGMTIAANVNLAPNITGKSTWNSDSNSNGTITITGNVGSTSDVIFNKGGATGTVVLNGTNTFTGSVLVEAGVLTLGGTNSYTGATTVSGGSLGVNFSSSTATDTINSASSLVLGGVRGGGSVTITGKNTAGSVNSQTFNGLTVDSSASTLNIVNGISSGNTLVNLGGITHKRGGTVSFVQPTVNTTISASNGFTTSTSNTNGILGAWATISGTTWATNNGTNIVAYTGFTDLADALAVTDATTNARVSAGSTWDISSSSVDMNTLLVKDTVARIITVGAGNTLRFGAAGGILTPTSTGTLTIGAAGNSGKITAGGADNTDGELIITNATPIVINSEVANNGTGVVALTKSGAGTLTLSSSNSNTGGTTVNAGTLTIDGGAPVVVSGTTFSGAAPGANSSQVNVSNTAGLAVGQSVWGPNIRDNTTIIAIDGNIVTLSQPTNLSSTGTTTYSLNYSANTSRLGTTGDIVVNGGTLNLGASLQNTSGAVVFGGGTVSNGKIVKTGANYDARNGTVSAVLSGTVGLVKTTSGGLVLSNTVSNTFTGTTTIREGSVTAGSTNPTATALGGDLVVGSVNGGNSASFANSGTNLGLTASKAITVYSNGSVGLGSGAQHVTGQITLIGGSFSGSQVYLDGAPVNMTGGTFGGTMYGNSGSTFTINPSTDTATISAYFSSNSQTFAVADGAADVDLAYTGNISVAGKSLTKTGAGLMVMSNANGYTGATNVSGGTLRLKYGGFGVTNTNMINAASALTLGTGGGGKLDVVGVDSTTISQTFASLAVNAGNNTISASSGASGTTNVILGSTLTRASGGTVNFVTPSSGSFTTTATTNTPNGVLVSAASNGVAFATINGTDWATVTGGTIGALASYNTNDFSAAANNVDVTSDQSPDAGFNVNTLRFNTANTTLTLSGSNQVSSGGILVSSAGDNVAITSGTIAAGGGNELVVINNGKLDIGSTIAGSSKSLTLTGSGTTTLSGNNSYGATNIYSGTVIATNANSFGTTGVVGLNGGTLQSSNALTLARAVYVNNNSTIGGSNDLTFSGLFTGGSGANRTLTVNNSGMTTMSGTVQLSSNGTPASFTVDGTGDVLVSGVVWGSSAATSAGNLIYAGSGKMTLTNGGNSYSGVTKVTGGTLSAMTLADGGLNSSIGRSTNAASNLVVDGGTFQYTGGDVSTDRLFSVGNLGGALDASGSGVVNFTNTGAIGFNGVQGERTLTLTGINTGNNTLAASITDSALDATHLVKNGPGTWVLSGSNSYTGNTTLNGGSLIVSGTISASKLTTVKDGAVLAGTGLVGNVLVTALTPGSTAGGVVDPGAGAASVAGNGVVTGNDAIGKLTVGSFNLGVGTHLAMQAAGATAGSADQIVTTGALTLGGDAQISLIGGYVPVAGDALYLILNGSNTAVSGIFSSLNSQNAVEGSTVTINGSQFTLTYQANGDGGIVANDVALMAVPEPSTWALIVGGLGMFAVAKRTRRNRA